MTAHAVPVDVVPEPIVVSVRVIAPLPGDPPHWAIHADERPRAGSADHPLVPIGTHVNDRPVGTASGADPAPIESSTYKSSNEFAAGEIEAVVYAVRLTLSYELVRRVAAIAMSYPASQASEGGQG
jgi:hypothetical protein